MLEFLIMKKNKIICIIITITIVLIFIIIYLVTQSLRIRSEWDSTNPSQLTMKRKISSHIKDVSFSVITITGDVGKLPNSLSEVSDYYKSRFEYKFNYGITYQILEPTSGKFELCALYPYEDLKGVLISNSYNETFSIHNGKLCAVYTIRK